MKINKTLHFTWRSTLAVFFTTAITAALVGVMGFLLFRTGILSFDDSNPLVMLLLFFLSSAIIGTTMSLGMSRKYFKGLNPILAAISEIGKGNFDIEFDTSKDKMMKEFSENLNQMARELKKVEIMKSDFIQNFSHEFKTPIVSIQGFTKRLLTKNLSEEKKNEYLGIILEESKRLVLLSTNTLYMSKLDSMEIVSECKDFSLDEQIRQSVLLFEKQWESKNIDFEVDIPEIQYYGNEELLKQVWINLFNNAIKFTGENGKIIVSATSTENDVVVSVSDSGVGMDNEVKAHIFDKYYQGDKSHSVEGNGLGLSIVKKIISLSGGNITVQSELNKGTTFTITLPKRK